MSIPNRRHRWSLDGIRRQVADEAASAMRHRRRGHKVVVSGQRLFEALRIDSLDAADRLMLLEETGPGGKLRLRTFAAY